MPLAWLIPPGLAPGPCSGTGSAQGCLKVLSLRASVSPLVNAGVVTAWGKEMAGPSWDVQPLIGLVLASGPLPKPIQCPAALQEAQAVQGLRCSMLG